MSFSFSTYLYFYTYCKIPEQTGLSPLLVHVLSEDWISERFMTLLPPLTEVPYFTHMLYFDIHLGSG